MLHNQAIKQVYICVSKAAEIQVLINLLGLLRQLLQTSCDLKIYGFDSRRDEAVCAIVPADRGGMGRVIVGGLRRMNGC